MICCESLRETSCRFVTISFILECVNQITIIINLLTKVVAVFQFTDRKPMSCVESLLPCAAPTMCFILLLTASECKSNAQSDQGTQQQRPVPLTQSQAFSAAFKPHSRSNRLQSQRTPNSRQQSRPRAGQPFQLRLGHVLQLLHARHAPAQQRWLIHKSGVDVRGGEVPQRQQQRTRRRDDHHDLLELGCVQDPVVDVGVHVTALVARGATHVAGVLQG